MRVNRCLGKASLRCEQAGINEMRDFRPPGHRTFVRLASSRCGSELQHLFLSVDGGADGTRTRDLRLDRPAF